MEAQPVMTMPEPPDDEFTEPDPHDIVAEQAVLGSMMLSAAEVANCRALLDSPDFYRPAHQVIFSAIVAMDGAGRAIDPVTVKDFLEAAGDLRSAGGPAYLHTLIASVPATVNAGYYARIVRDKAVRRRLLAAGHRIVQLARSAAEDAHGLAERAVREAEEVREGGQYDDIATPTITEFLDVPGDDDEYDWIVPDLLERGDRFVLTGTEGAGKALALDTPIPTPKGWTTMGALSVGDEVFGPDGTSARIIATTAPMSSRPCYRMRFTDGSEIVADADHQWLTRTLACREADAKTRHRGPLKLRGTDQRHKRVHFPAVVTTEHVASTLQARGGHTLNHSVDVCAPLQYPAQELPIAPYTLGAWLGDGTSATAAITCADADAEILDAIRAEGYAVTPGSGPIHYRISNRPERERRIKEGRRLAAGGMGAVAAAAHVGIHRGNLAGTSCFRPGQRPAAPVDPQSAPLLPYRELPEIMRNLGVLDNKHIPAVYLHSSVEQRLALLQGLMDTDGTVSGEGSRSGRGKGAATCEFSVCSERLARDVHELLLGLGIKVTFREGPAVLNGRRVGTRYRLNFQTDLPVFRLARKAQRLTPLRTQRAKLRYIEAAEPVESVPVRCIQVDRGDGMFLAGRECIPTHNSTLFRQFGVTIAAGIHPFDGYEIEPKRVLVVDCENGPAHIRRKIRPLVIQAASVGHPVSDTNLWIEVRPEGLDLAADKDISWLLRRVTAIRPDVVLIGPLYRLAPRALNDDSDAAPVIATLNMIRARGACVGLEAHAGHALGMGGRRDLRPRGSSAFLGWPEFGFGIRSSDLAEAKKVRLVDVVPWRGDRDERNWPERLKAGGEWPWSAYVHFGDAEDAWTPSSSLRSA
jgi:replicative DNA helicase